MGLCVVLDARNVAAKEASAVSMSPCESFLCSAAFVNDPDYHFSFKGEKSISSKNKQ